MSQPDCNLQQRQYSTKNKKKMFRAPQCRSFQPTTMVSDVYSLYFSRNNIDKILNTVQSMGFPRPASGGDGLYRQMYRIYQLYPGYQAVDASRWDSGAVWAHVEFMNNQFLQMYLPEMRAKRMLYEAYDRDRTTNLRPIPNPVMDSVQRRCGPIDRSAYLR